jgi:MFS family permease
VLLGPIQKELHVGDAAMGVLSGSASAMIYAVVALPLARLADRTNRRNLLSLAVAVWSAATAICGVVGGYFQLLFARALVGSAESVQMPATVSLIGDMFPAVRRGAAIAAIIIGSALGFAAGSAIAGALSDTYGWRVAVMGVGGRGLVIAAILFFTVKEPKRGEQDGLARTQVAKRSLAQSLLRAARIRTLYPFALGWILLQGSYSAYLVWMPSFFTRVFHISATKMGALFGLTIACSTLAAFVAGPLSDILARRGARWRLYYCCLVIALGAPCIAGAALAPTLAVSFGWLLAYNFVGGGLSTVATVSYVSFSPPTMRAFISALMNLLAAVLGAGLAPPLYGLLNDHLKPTYGDQSLRYTMLLSPALMAVVGLLFLLSSRTFDRDVAATSEA